MPTHSEEQKLRIALKSFDSNTTLSAVAREYKISRPTLDKWRRTIKESGYLLYGYGSIVDRYRREKEACKRLRVQRDDLLDFIRQNNLTPPPVPRENATEYDEEADASGSETAN